MGTTTSSMQDKYDEFAQKTSQDIELLKAQVYVQERTIKDLLERLVKLEKTELMSHKTVERDDAIL